VGVVDDDESSDKDTEVCVTEWVETSIGKSVTCSFLKPRIGKKDEMKFTFDVSKCDKLFDRLLQNKMIRLKGGHLKSTVEHLACKKYCKWHDSFSHMTNECNYFRRQIQSALNDGHLTFGENSQMKLDVDPFPVDMINFEERRVLVRTDQVATTEGKRVAVSNDLG
jgi:hypothetical protein